MASRGDCNAHIATHIYSFEVKLNWSDGRPGFVIVIGRNLIIIVVGRVLCVINIDFCDLFYFSYLMLMTIICLMKLICKK